MNYDKIFNLIRNYILIQYFIYHNDECNENINKCSFDEFMNYYIDMKIKNFDINMEDAKMILTLAYGLNLDDILNENMDIECSLSYEVYNNIIKNIDNSYNSITADNCDVKKNLMKKYIDEDCLYDEKCKRICEYMNIMGLDFDITDDELRDIDKQLNIKNSEISVQEFINKKN